MTSCPLKREVAQAVDGRLGIVQEVGDEHDEAALPHRLGEVVQRLPDGRPGAEFGRFEVRQERVEVAGRAARRDAKAEFAVEEGEADGVALPDDEVGQRSGEVGGVGQLRHLARAVAHRRADVHEEVEAGVGLVLELLDVVAIRPGEELPIDVGGVVARHVGPVLHELHADALVRALVQPGDEPLHDAPRQQLQVGDAGEDVRVDEPGGGRLDGRHAVRGRMRGKKRRQAYQRQRHPSDPYVG